MSQKMLSHPKKMTFRELFKKGDLPTKLSFLFMGTANLCNKQIPKAYSS